MCYYSGRFGNDSMPEKSQPPGLPGQNRLKLLVVFGFEKTTNAKMWLNIAGLIVLYNFLQSKKLRFDGGHQGSG